MVKILIATTLDDQTGLALERAIKISGLTKSEYWRRLVMGTLQDKREPSVAVKTQDVFMTPGETIIGNPIWGTGGYKSELEIIPERAEEEAAGETVPEREPEEIAA